MTATVAECSNSERPGPANVAPNKRVVIKVDDHAGLAGVTVGVKLCASHRFPDLRLRLEFGGRLAGLDGRSGRPRRPRVGEEYLRHSVVIGGGGVGAPRRGVHGLSGCPIGDRCGGDTRLVFALMREQGSVIGVAHRVEPAALDGGHLARVIDLQPAAAGETDGVQADVTSPGCPAGGEHLVDL